MRKCTVYFTDGSADNFQFQYVTRDECLTLGIDGHCGNRDLVAVINTDSIKYVRFIQEEQA